MLHLLGITLRAFAVVLVLSFFQGRADATPTDVSFYYPTGNLTCSGDPYYGHEYTAAAAPYFYPVGTVLDVEWPMDSGNVVRVVVNDCTPYAHTFDLSYAAASSLGYDYPEGRVFADVRPVYVPY
jgi:rare lipoprotein A (peptidoglycan hydrolase)